MNCAAHYACPCKEEMLADAVEALASLLASFDRHDEAIAPHDRIKYRKRFHAVPSAKSVLRRYRNIV